MGISVEGNHDEVIQKKVGHGTYRGLPSAYLSWTSSLVVQLELMFCCLRFKIWMADGQLAISDRTPWVAAKPKAASLAGLRTGPPVIYQRCEAAIKARLTGEG
jgi:hypothetical protein